MRLCHPAPATHSQAWPITGGPLAWPQHTLSGVVSWVIASSLTTPSPEPPPHQETQILSLQGRMGHHANLDLKWGPPASSCRALQLAQQAATTSLGEGGEGGGRGDSASKANKPAPFVGTRPPVSAHAISITGKEEEQRFEPS